MTANDSDVSDGETLTGSQVVRVYGQNLTAPFVILTFGDVEYTPLTQGEGYIEFILGDNGTATISVDGSSFMSFEIEGIVIPEVLPIFMKMVQASPDNQYINGLEGSMNCMNYNYAFNSDYPSFIYQWYRSGKLADIDIDDFQFYNCTRVIIAKDSNQVLLRLRLNDENEVAYVTYQGFIIAVFNYTTE